MVLPTKHISLRNSYLGAGVTVLRVIKRPITVDRLWLAVRHEPNVANSHRFYHTLDLLFMLGAIVFVDSKIRRA